FLTDDRWQSAFGWELDCKHSNGVARVEIAGKWYDVPSFETAEAFINSLAHDGILRIDSVVAAFQSGSPMGVSDRSLRRHVAHTTGQSPHQLHQIQRAQYAVQLLQQGTSIAQTAVEAGYTD